MRALLGALKQPAEKSGVPQLNSPAVDRERRRKEVLAAARRLQDGDIWKEKVKAQLNIETLDDSSTRIWTHKAVKENFQRWLEAPERLTQEYIATIVESKNLNFRRGLKGQFVDMKELRKLLKKQTPNP